MYHKYSTFSNNSFKRTNLEDEVHDDVSSWISVERKHVTRVVGTKTSGRWDIYRYQNVILY